MYRLADKMDEMGLVAVKLGADIRPLVKVIVSFSGGKDSLACLLWAVEKYGAKNIEAVFCDTGWEHELTYAHINEVTAQLNVKLITLKSKRYDGMIDLARQKKRFASAKARFCTEELKSKPMIDYILDECKCHVIVIQGIRAEESASRAAMKKQCSYFKYYFQPYGYGQNQTPKYHTYRKDDITEWKKNYSDDVLRPMFAKTGHYVMQYILGKGFKPNPLYYMGAGRVGCFPCHMATLPELKATMENNPKYRRRLVNAEKTVGGSTFFPPDYIPAKYATGKDEKTGKAINTFEDVMAYLKTKDYAKAKPQTDSNKRKCMSFYGICE